MIDLTIKMDKNSYAKIILLQSVIIVLISVYAAIVTLFVRDNNVIQQNTKTISNIHVQSTLPCVNDSRKATDIDYSDPLGKIRDLIFAKNETDEMEIRIPQWLLLSQNRHDRLRRAAKRRKGPKSNSPVIILTPRPEEHHREHQAVGLMEIKWKKSPLSISTNRDFEIIDNMHLQVKQTGRYLIFASVHYKDTLPTRTYAIKGVANEKFYADCKDHTTCTHNNPPTIRESRCNSTAVVHLTKDEKLWLVDTQSSLGIVTEALPDPHKTFWGLVKLSKIHDSL